MLPLIETWKSLFEWSSVGLLALTFVAGAGTLITTQIINRRQAAVILDLEKSAADAKAVQQKVEIELAKAKTKQAEAEKALLELQNLIREPRALNIEHAAQLLENAIQTESMASQGTGVGTVDEISFVLNNQEAGNLARPIGDLLRQHGWDVPAQPFPAISDPPPAPGIFITVHGETRGRVTNAEYLSGPEGTLFRVLEYALHGNPALLMTSEPNKAPDTIGIFIGPKY